MTGKFENGVSYFTKGVAEITVNFPEDFVSCQFCPFCRGESDLKRYWCRLTNNMIYSPFGVGLPDGCPIEIKE